MMMMMMIRLIVLPESLLLVVVVTGGFVGVRRDDAPVVDVLRFVVRPPLPSFLPRFPSPLFPEGGRFSSSFTIRK